MRSSIKIHKLIPGLLIALAVGTIAAVGTFADSSSTSDVLPPSDGEWECEGTDCAFVSDQFGNIYDRGSGAYSIYVSSGDLIAGFNDIVLSTCVQTAYDAVSGEPGISPVVYNKSGTINATRTATELKKIKSLNCSSDKIWDTTGLEQLTALTNLNLQKVYDNNLSLAKNVTLTDLTINDSAITDLDLSKNTKLININVSNNQLKKISFGTTAHATVKNLFADNNKLTTLDAASSSNPDTLTVNLLTGLISLSANGNSISSVNLAKNTKLNYLYLSNNNLSEIDLSKNINLNNVELANNQLSNIDLAKLAKLNFINVEGNTNLSSIDISNNTALWGANTHNTGINLLDLSTNDSFNITASTIKPHTILKDSRVTTVSDNTNIYVRLHNLPLMMTTYNDSSACTIIDSNLYSYDVTNKNIIIPIANKSKIPSGTIPISCWGYLKDSHSASQIIYHLYAFNGTGDYTQDENGQSDSYTCWDGSTASSASECPARPSYTCWNGTVVSSASECPARPINTYYIVEFDSNGGSLVGTDSVIAGTPVDRPENPTRDGYTFKYWSLDGTTAYDFSAAVTSDIVLTAVWEKSIAPSTSIKYTLNYDANGGTGAPASQTCTSSTGSCTFTIPVTVPTREGYTFLGWQKPSTSSDYYKAGGTVILFSDAPTLTMTAKWEESANASPEIITENYLGEHMKKEIEKCKDTTCSDPVVEKTKQAVNNGHDISLTVTLNEIAPSTEEKSEAIRVSDTFTPVVYYDINYTVVDNTAKITLGNVTKLTEPLPLSVSLPENMPALAEGATRSFIIIRFHDGQVDRLEANFDATTNTVSFATDRFSTYALAYQDAILTDGAATTAQSTTLAPNTGVLAQGVIISAKGTNPVAIFLIATAISAAVVYLAQYAYARLSRRTRL